MSRNMYKIIVFLFVLAIVGIAIIGKFELTPTVGIAFILYIGFIFTDPQK